MPLKAVDLEYTVYGDRIELEWIKAGLLKCRLLTLFGDALPELETAKKKRTAGKNSRRVFLVQILYMRLCFEG